MLFDTYAQPLPAWSILYAIYIAWAGGLAMASLLTTGGKTNFLELGRAGKTLVLLAGTSLLAIAFAWQLLFITPPYIVSLGGSLWAAFIAGGYMAVTILLSMQNMRASTG